MSTDELVDLEEQGWRALSTGGGAAREFYDRVLDRSVVMLLPGGMRLDDREQILDSMSGEPWSSFDLEDVQVLGLTADTGVVLYGVVARQGADEYSALMSSVYVRREGGWRLAFHQQTPR